MRNARRLMLGGITLGAVLATGLVGPASAMPAQSEGASARSDATTGSQTAASPAKYSGIENVGTLVSRPISVKGLNQRISYPGATYIKVHFSELKLSPGDWITVSDPRNREVYRYHANPRLGAKVKGDAAFTLHKGKGFAAMSIEGDTAIVKLHSASGKARARGSVVRIDGYWRGYNAEEYAKANPVPTVVCGVDARRDSICYKTSNPTEYGKSRAVVRLLMGGSACTAWRVGNTNRMLTNNHCMSTQSVVDSSESQFDYECQTCGGNNPKTPVKVSGASLIRTNSSLDYTLYSVDNFSSITSFGTLYLENRQPTQGERIYIPGHGDAKPKRIAIYIENQGGTTCKVDRPQADSVNLGYNCDTSGGNSGSPVIAGSSHKVIGLHHLGSCPYNLGVRIKLVYDQISGQIDNRG